MQYYDFSSISDKELIKMYRCQKCDSSTIQCNQKCQLCYKAIIELNSRHQEVIKVYGFKLWKEFHIYDGSKDVEDYEEELRFEMIANINNKLTIDRINENFEAKRIFYLTYLKIRTLYTNNKNQRYKYNFHEVYFDDVMNEDRSDIGNVLHKTIERITKNTDVDFTQKLCNNMNLKDRMKTLNDAEKFILNKLLEGWKQKDIAKELKCSQPQITVLKRKIAQKLYNIK